MSQLLNKREVRGTRSTGICLGILLAGLAGSVNAADLPPPFKDVKTGKNGVIAADQMSAAQRAFLWKDTVQEKGYIRVKVGRDYLGMIDAFSTMPNYEPMKKMSQEAALDGLQIAGRVAEGSNRNTFIINGRDGHQIAMVTVWDYKKDGARISRTQEFLNQKVAAMDATLSLAVAGESGQALWKVGAMNQETSYEIYIRENLDRKGVPDRQIPEVVALTEQLLRVTRRRVGL